MEYKNKKRYSFVVSDPVIIELLESKKEPLTGYYGGISEYIRHCVEISYLCELLRQGKSDEITERIRKKNDVRKHR